MEKQKIELEDPTFRVIPQCSGHNSTYAALRCPICSGTPAYLDPTFSEIVVRDEHVAVLESNLAIAVDALEHYADDFNWSQGPLKDGYQDWYQIEKVHGFDIGREALAKIRGEK